MNSDYSSIDSLPYDQGVNRKALNRLKCTQGQRFVAVRAVTGDAHCRVIMQQFPAASESPDRAGFRVISTTLRNCVTARNADNAANPDELEKLFLSLA